MMLMFPFVSASPEVKQPFRNSYKQCSTSTQQKFTDLSCNACRNTVHFLLCRKIAFCSTDILLPVCWGHCTASCDLLGLIAGRAAFHCFAIINGVYNPETGLNSFFFVVSLKMFPARPQHFAALRSVQLTNFCVQLWNIKPVRCM